MKILFAVKRMEDAAGGAERVLATVAGGLAARGHEVAVLSFDPPESRSFHPLSPALKRLFVPVGDPSRPSGFVDTARRVGALRAAVKAHAPDVVAAFMHSMFVPMALALAGTGIPLVASEHIVPDHYRGRTGQFALMLLASLMAEKVTVVSAQARALYPAFARSRMVVVPNPVESLPEAPAPWERSTTILSVGRLDPQKDHEILIEAFALLAPRHREWSLRIVGEGPLRPALEARIAAMGLEGRVALPGTVRDMACEYRRAAFFVMPSRYESFGLTTAEAMAAQLPVVGFSDCPGTNELIAHGRNGFLVPSRTAGALAEAIETLIRNPPLREAMGREGPPRLVDFQPGRVTDQWEKLLREAL